MKRYETKTKEYINFLANDLCKTAVRSDGKTVKEIAIEVVTAYEEADGFISEDRDDVNCGKPISKKKHINNEALNILHGDNPLIVDFGNYDIFERTVEMTLLRFIKDELEEAFNTLNN